MWSSDENLGYGDRDAEVASRPDDSDFAVFFFFELRFILLATESESLVTL